jgi:hypothetical protein
MKNPTDNTPRPDDPLPWLLTLEMARQRGDFAQADAAKRELERLGVRVTYTPAKRKAVRNAR